MSKRSLEQLGTQKPRDVVKALKRLGGFVMKTKGKRRGKGSHALVKMPNVLRPITVMDDEHDRAMLKTICREAELDPGTFAKAFMK